MSQDLTPSALRANLYKVLDQILETGEPIDIVRKGKRLRITAISSSKLANLTPHPDCINGDPESLVSEDWSAEWNSDLP